MTDKIAELTKQIEFYLSDKNLETDAFFHEQILKSNDQYINVGVLLNCNKIKKLTTSAEDVREAIEASELLSLSKDRNRFKRNKEEIPELNLLGRKRENEEEKVEKVEKKDEIVLFSITSSCVSEIRWKQIQDAILKANPGLEISYLRFSSDSGHLGIYSSMLTNLVVTSVEVEDVKIDIKKTEGDQLLDFWKMHGQHLNMCLGKVNNNRRDKKSKANESKHSENDDKFDKSKEKAKFKLSKPIQLGTMKFLDVKDIRQKARTILNNIKNDEQPLPHDEKFLKDILTYHPNEHKSDNFDYFTTGQNPDYPGSKCFLIAKKDGTKTDFSINKCLEVIQEKFGSA